MPGMMGLLLNNPAFRGAQGVSGPTVTITSDAVAPTKGPFTIIITFDDEVTGFAYSDVKLGNCVMSNFVTADNTVWTATITPTIDVGIVTVDIPAAVCTDLAGNANKAATQFSLAVDLYILRDEFTTADAAPITTPRTSEPGPGVLEFSDAGAPDLSIANGKLAKTATTNISVTTASPTPFVPGLALLFSTNYTAGGSNMRVGFSNEKLGVPVDRISPSYLSFLETFSGYYSDQRRFAVIYTDTLVLYINCTTSKLTLIKPRYYDYNLGDVYTRVTSTNDKFEMDSIAVLALGAPFNSDAGLATVYETEPVSGSQYEASADAIHRFTFVLNDAPSAGEEVSIDYRIGDQDNKWRAIIRRNETNTAWDYCVRQVVGGSEIVPAGWTDVLNVGTPTGIDVMCEGTQHRFLSRSGKTVTSRGAILDVSHQDTATAIAAVYPAETSPEGLQSYPISSSAYANPQLYLGPGSGVSQPDPVLMEPMSVTGDQVFPYAELAAGGIVELADGIYALDPATTVNGYHINIPAGGTLKAAAGAKPIITRTDGYAPTVVVNSGATLEGCWIGGAKAAAPATPNQHVHVKPDCVVRYNTFFGFWECLGSDFTRVHIYRNRFIECGSGVHYHSLYYTNHDITQAEDEPLIEENIFIGGEGYAIHFWHDPTYGKVRGNFLGDVLCGMVIDGDNGTFQKNIVWSSTGIAVLAGTGSNQTITDTLIGSLTGSVTSAVTNSYFMSPKELTGTNPTQWTRLDLSTNLGVTTDQIREAIDGIRAVVVSSIADLRTKQAIADAHFATLQSLISAWVSYSES